jgi:DNA polymerase III gamma/tau subunit
VVAGVCDGNDAILDISDEEAKDLRDQAKMVSKDTLHRIFKHFSEAYEAIARSSHPRILLETALARIADLGELVPAIELVARLERLASGTGNSGPPAGAPPVTPRRNPTTGSATPPSSSRATAPGAVPSVEGPRNRAPSAPEPTPSTTDISQSDFERAVEDIKKEKPAMASFLGYGVPKVGPRGLSISFSPDYASIAALAKDRIPEIETYLLERFGQKVRVEVIIDKTSVAPTAHKQRIEQEDRRREKRDAAVAHPLVQRIQSELGANVSQVQLLDTPRPER